MLRFIRTALDPRASASLIRFTILALALLCAAQTFAGACCINGQCSIRTETSCQADGGAWQGVGSTCMPNPCTPPANGACCINGQCSIRTEASCHADNGVWQGAGTTCSQTTCTPPPTGA